MDNQQEVKSNEDVEKEQAYQAFQAGYEAALNNSVEKTINKAIIQDSKSRIIKSIAIRAAIALVMSIVLFNISSAENIFAKIFDSVLVFFAFYMLASFWTILLSITKNYVVNIIAFIVIGLLLSWFLSQFDNIIGGNVVLDVVFGIALIALAPVVDILRFLRLKKAEKEQ